VCVRSAVYCGLRFCSWLCCRRFGAVSGSLLLARASPWLSLILLFSLHQRPLALRDQNRFKPAASHCCRCCDCSSITPSSILITAGLFAVLLALRKRPNVRYALKSEVAKKMAVDIVVRLCVLICMGCSCLTAVSVRIRRFLFGLGWCLRSALPLIVRAPPQSAGDCPLRASASARRLPQLLASGLTHDMSLPRFVHIQQTRMKEESDLMAKFGSVTTNASS
jgi:hypothetical protein